MKWPAISVVMLTYNHEKYIAEAIEGVLRQTCISQVELLVGEDCSTDSTRAIVEQYAKRYPDTVRIVSSETNVGSMSNFIRTVRSASGQYIAFCDGDDYWHEPGKLEADIKLLEMDQGMAMVCSNYRIIDEDGNILCDRGVNNDHDAVIAYDDLLEKLVVLTAGVCARGDLVREAFDSSKLLQDTNSPIGDLPLWAELVQRGTCLMLSRVAVTYRASLNSATRQNSWRSRRIFAMRNCETIYQLANHHPLRDPRRQSKLETRVVRSALRLAMALGDRDSAWMHWRTLGNRPGRLRLIDTFALLFAVLPLFRNVAIPMYDKYWGRRRIRNFWDE